MDQRELNVRLLEETFSYARLALSNVILINGVAASAIAAFLAHRVGPVPAGMHNAILRFAVGAGLGGVASLLGYFGQRLDWNLGVGRGLQNPIFTNATSGVTLATAVTAYIPFFAGCYAASTAF